ncbi:discoidin domain-containing protein [Saccharopolyspora sp. ASAGF58]|uniref:discoidin domain-containing protein n=1 Tax=Saccharopolyspora sp. ASAGF58 TaxID=2719023 RepID=UPI00143FF0C4|nr:discoidin domain-containing protein [Saccharopolyspora sp. ASAGF58]QIZ38225.1 discoidin domain-containing protein [Saccharopolyspora sp. ASAGF58]
MRPVSDEASVSTFRMWWRALDSAEWLPASRLLVHVSGGGSAALEQLAWTSEDGTHTAVGFSGERTSCYGHRRAAGGDLVEIRGELDGHTVGYQDTTHQYEFDTEVQEADSWHPAGRLRLLIDDGGQAPLRWAAWRDRSGNSCSVALRSVGPSGNPDVTGLVTVVWASAQYREAGEVAANLIDPSSSKWFAPHSRASLEFQLKRPVAAYRYVLTSANDAPDRDPAAWTLRGSTDGQLWRTLDTRTGQSFADRHQSKTYRIAGPGAYDYYRLDITGNNGSPDLQLESVRFFADSASGFAGYRQHAGYGPIAYRGVRPALESPDKTPPAPLPDVLPARPPVPAVLSQLPSLESAPLVRTDFSDDNLWATTHSEIISPRQYGPDTFSAYVEPVDDVKFEGLTAEQLVQLVPPGVDWPFLMIADKMTMESAEHHVLVVDLDDDDVRTFRATPLAAAEIENNLSIANMDWEDFADSADDDGIVRPMLSYDPEPPAGD